MSEQIGRNVVELTLVAIIVVAAVIKLVQLSRARSQVGVNRPAVAAMCAAIIAISVAVAQETPAVVPLLNEALGVNIAYAQRHTPALLCFFFLRMAFMFWVWPPGRRRRQSVRTQTLIIVVVLVARWTLALAAPPGEAARALAGDWGAAPVTMAAMLIYVAYMLTTIGSVVALALVWARSVTGRRRWTGRGLRLIALGGIGFELYLAHKIVFLVVALTLGYPPYDQVLVEWYVLVPSTLVLVVGLAMPLVATGVPAAIHLARQRAAYGRIGPLWMALTLHRPEVVLSARPDWLPARLGPVWDRVALRELGFRLYRRVIECWDVVIALHGHLDARVREDVVVRARECGCDDDEAGAIGEAVMIRTALENARDGAETVPEQHRAHPRDRHPQLQDNVAWWQRVARAWGHPLTATLSPPLNQLS